MPGEWWTRTWNPMTGCSPVSEGCRNCWAARMAKRLAGRCGYPPGDGFAPTFHADRLDEPLRRRQPEVYFTCGMGDLFHPDVPLEWIGAVWMRMAACPQHTFMVLTKRPERAAEVLSGTLGRWRDCGICYVPSLSGTGGPLQNLWLGTSIEDQATADERIPWLLRTPAAHRFVSYEPALGPVDFRAVLWEHDSSLTAALHYLNLVIGGGETGPGARPSHPDWFRSVRDQCAAAGVLFHLKQMAKRGRSLPIEQWPADLQIQEFLYGKPAR